MPRSVAPKSLAFLQFKADVTNEIRKFWMKICALHYAGKYLDAITKEDRELRVGDIANHKDTFLTNLNLTYAEYLHELPTTEEYIRQDSIVNLISIFENYLLLAYCRGLHLTKNFEKPEKIKDENQRNIPISDVEEIVWSRNPILRFSEYSSSRIFRNKKTMDMVDLLCSFVKSGARKENERKLDFELLDSNSLLRNAIVHNSRMVTEDMANKDSNMRVGVKINTDNKDVTALSSACLRIIESIDSMYCKNVIKFYDAKLFAKELRVFLGKDKGLIAQKVYYDLGIKFTSNDMDSIFAELNRGDFPEEYIFSRALLG